jgi:hypothetical protein
MLFEDPAKRLAQPFVDQLQITRAVAGLGLDLKLQRLGVQPLVDLERPLATLGRDAPLEQCRGPLRGGFDEAADVLHLVCTVAARARQVLGSLVRDQVIAARRPLGVGDQQLAQVDTGECCREIQRDQVERNSAALSAAAARALGELG